MPKVKTIEHSHKGIILIYDMMVSASGEFYVAEKGLPQDLLEFIKKEGRIHGKFPNFKTFQEADNWFLKLAKTFLEDGIKTEYIIAAFIKAHHKTCEVSHRLGDEMRIPTANSPKFTTDSPDSGFQMDWKILKKKTFGETEVFYELKEVQKDWPTYEFSIGDYHFKTGSETRFNHPAFTIIPFTKESYEFFKNMDIAIVGMVKQIIGFIHCEPEQLQAKILSSTNQLMLLANNTPQ